MGRMSVHILDDDREADSAAYMLEACGVEPDDFYDNERVITRENLEKNYKFLVKMVDVRQPGEALKNHINFEGLYNSGRDGMDKHLLEIEKMLDEGTYPQ